MAVFAPNDPGPGLRLPTHRDPTADAATGGTRLPASAPTFQCARCGAMGTGADASSWPEVVANGRRVRLHVRSRLVVDELAAMFGVEQVATSRTLCGRARRFA